MSAAADAMPPDTLNCRQAARAAVELWLHSVEHGDTNAARRALSPSFSVISAGRNGWPEPFFRADSMSQVMAYVLRRAGKHERFSHIAVPTGEWKRGRLGLGVVSYIRTADDISESQSWLGKGEFDCGRGIHVLNTAPQGEPPKRR